MGTNKIYEILTVVEEIKKYLLINIDLEHQFNNYNYDCQKITDRSWILTSKACGTETTIPIERSLDCVFDNILYIHSTNILDMLNTAGIPFADVYFSTIKLSPSILYKVYVDGDSYRVEI